MKKNKFSGVYAALMLLFLYAPIIILIVFSFNSEKGYSWQGFSLKWYKELFSNELIMKSFANTLIVALVASVVATVLGALAAIGVHSMNNKVAKGLIKNVTNFPLINPEIVTGISLMLLFAATRMNGNGWGTLIIAHITFCVPSVFLSILPKLRQINVSLYEAAMDLGCSPAKAFQKVVIPEIMPGIITGFLMAFTYSIDDFVISFFTAGNLQTLPITIYSMVRKRVSPEINALSTLIFVVVLAVLLFTNIRDIRKEKEREKKSAARR
ncbi:MAG: ABC transporter permease [Clostridia bacterium]|nr:ABC transporter permease [Clostridia bacterium]